jgi:hypothetical protein
MEDVNAYHIRVRGPVDQDDLNAGSPLHMIVAESGPDAALLTVSADQAGMVGLIRHLHGLGYVLLAVIRCPEEAL